MAKKEYRIEELIDIPLFQALQDKLNAIYSFPSAIIDNDGNVLTATAWQDLCVKFHRAHPECLKACKASDKYIQDHLGEAKPAVTYNCPHGLVDNATPIVIGGRHLANYFTGQFFLEPPDMEFFRAQAKVYGFDEKEYLAAVAKVPVWSREKLAQYLDFVKGFTEIIAGIGYKNLQEKEAREALDEKENALAEERRRVERLMEVSPAGIVYVDAAGKITYANSRGEELLGLTRSELAERDYNAPVWKSAHLDGTPFREEEQPFAVVKNTGKPVRNIEQVISWPDGRRITLSINGSPLFTETGGFQGMVTALEDITERKRADENLRQSETRFRQLFDTMAEGFATHEIICDAEGRPADYRFLDVNPAFERLTGLKRTDLVGRTVMEVMPATEKVWIENYGRVALGGKSLQFESSAIALGKWYEVNAFSPRRGQFAVSFLDITERKNVQLALEKANKDLLEKKQDMENFLYITTHDLRSPLVNIQGFSRTLASCLKEVLPAIGRGDLPAETRDRALKLAGGKVPESLGYITGSVKKMDTMIKALLKVARLGRMEMRSEPVDMNALIKAALASLNYQLGQAEGAVKVATLPPCKADPVLVGQIFGNLLDNAIKYRDRGRKLEITVGGERKEAGTVVYTVSDNGPGIKADELEKIGQIFYRGSAQAGSEGEGIGLAMGKRMAEMSGGRLRVESKEGEGAKFIVELPYAG